MTNFTPKAQADAVSHLVATLNKLASDAERQAEKSQASATESVTRKWRVRHEESAEYHTALTVLAKRAADEIQQKPEEWFS